MNTLFNKLISGRQFNFQPIEFGQTMGYHVDVKDQEGTRWEFRMLQDGEKQFTVEGENLPAWISEATPELIRAVNEHE